MIRKVTKSDYETIARLLIKAFKNPPWNEEWDYHRALQRVEQLDDGKHTRCYVYLIDNKIAGVMCGKIVTYVKSVDFYQKNGFSIKDEVIFMNKKLNNS